MKSVNALLDLLTAAGLDTVDNSQLDREAERCIIELRQSRDSLPEDPQAWDRHVEKLVRQLKESLRDAPERNEEFMIEEPARQLPVGREMAESKYEEPPLPPREDPEHDPHPEDRRQHLEREFSSTSYPKIGPGYSDSISVVSDLTTPTCVPGTDVPAEEHYAAGPPLSIGFSTRPSKAQLRRPSLENSGGPSNGNSGQNDRRAGTNNLRPPSRRVVTKPGGAAANRRQNHQMTMAHLEAATGTAGVPSRSASRDASARGSSNAPMSVNDFPSLKDASNSRSSVEDGDYKSSGRESGRRSLLRKSNKYAASVYATASQRVLLARQASAEQSTSKRSSRRSSTGHSSTAHVATRRSSTGHVESTAFVSPDRKDMGDFGFKGANDAKKSAGDPVLIDEDGFIIGANNTQDPFASASFGNDFPQDTFSNKDTFVGNGNSTTNSTTNNNSSFFPAPVKDTKKKKASNGGSSGSGGSGSGSRRASMGGKPPGKTKKKDEHRIDDVEKATKKKLEMLRREAEKQGDSAFGSKVDLIEQETMKQIRRLRDHHK